MLRGSVAFIAGETGLRLPAGFTLLGAVSGASKTTTSANVVAQALREKPGKVCAILNEETAVDFWERVACILAGASFFEHRKSPVPEVETVLMDTVIPRLMVHDGTTSAFDPCVMEDVVDVLRHVREHRTDYSMVLYDYLQNTTKSKEDPSREPWRISKLLGHGLKNYSREVELPVVVAAQLNPAPAGRDANAVADIRGRFQNDKHLFNHCVTCIEAKPDIAAKTCTFIVHKDRFGSCTGQSIRVHWREGMLLPEGAV